jgi:hypothetical protein
VAKPSLTGLSGIKFNENKNLFAIPFAGLAAAEFRCSDLSESERRRVNQKRTIMQNEPNFSKSQMFITLIRTTNYNKKWTMDTWSKQTQSNPILPASGGFTRHSVWRNLC